MAGRVGRKALFSWLPTLRFRAKVMLGFAAVLAISATSLGIAYLGFDRVSDAVVSYRTSVTEADLARNIDRELISYRSLVRYYVVTGKEDDAKAAQAAEAGLKQAIDNSLAGTQQPARLEGLKRLATEFKNFTGTFAGIVKVKAESALIVQNQLQSNANMLKYKLDDILSNASDAEQQAIESGSKRVQTQFAAASAAANTFVINADQTVARNALARLDFVASAFGQVYSMDDKLVAELKEAREFLKSYKTALQKLVENASTVEDLLTEMGGSAGAISQVAGAMKADLVSEQQRFDAQSNAIIGETENLIIMLAVGGTLLGAVLALLLGRGISRPMIAMCKAMRELAGGNFDVVLPGLGRKDELGEMAGGVEEVKMKAVAKAEGDAASQEAQNPEAGAGRRPQLSC